MDVSELRAMSDADLRDQYAESKRELFNLRMQLAARQLENFRRIREVRRGRGACANRARRAEPCRERAELKSAGDHQG